MSNQKTFTGRIALMYMGCEIRVPGGETYTLSPREFPSNWEDVCFRGIPILRSLDDITEEECREMFLVSTGIEWDKEASCKDNWWDKVCGLNVLLSILYHGQPSVWLYLLNAGFDLFGLIPAGLAERKQI